MDFATWIVQRLRETFAEKVLIGTADLFAVLYLKGIAELFAVVFLIGVANRLQKGAKEFPAHASKCLLSGYLLDR